MTCSRPVYYLDAILVLKRPLDLHRQVSLRFYVRIQWGPRDLAPWSYPTILAKGEYSAT